jgi:hypothetical protein
VSGIAVVDNGLVPCSEYKSFGSCGCDQESIRRVPVRLAG